MKIPAELESALDSNPEARQAFDSLSYSHRKEHAGYVGEAKKPETRARRAQATIERLR